MPIKTTFNKNNELKKITLLFFKKGYYATSMQDIVATTGLNRSSIYNTFGSKLELFIACFEKCENNFKTEIQKILLETTNPLKSLILIFENTIKPIINGQLNPNYINEIKSEEKAIRKLILNQHDYLEDLFKSIIRRGQDLGVINNSKSANQYAIYLITAYQGLKVMSHISEDENDLKNTIQNIIYILER